MATYIPNATQTTEPVESRTVESAALEFRTLKAFVNSRIEDVQDTLDAEIVNRIEGDATETAARIEGDANLQTQNNAQDVRLAAVENALLAAAAAAKGTEIGLPEIAIYAALRAYTGPLTAFYVCGAAALLDGGAGVFRVDDGDTVSADNGGTILVDVAGRRWKREFSGAVNVLWFGADPTGVADSTPAIQAAYDVARSALCEVDLHGSFKMGQIAFATGATPYVSFVVRGKITLTGTFTSGSRIAWIGRASTADFNAYTVQGPSGVIVLPDATDGFITSSSTLIKNIGFIGCGARSVIARGANVTFENVSITANNVASAICLTIDGGFWHCYRQLRLMGPSRYGVPTIDFRVGDIPANNTSNYLVEIDTARLWYGGIRFAQSLVTRPELQHNLIFKAVDFEVPNTHFFDFADSIHPVWSIRVDRCTIWDPVGLQANPAFFYTRSGAQGAVSVTLKNCDAVQKISGIEAAGANGIGLLDIIDCTIASNATMEGVTRVNFGSKQFGMNRPEFGPTHVHARNLISFYDLGDDGAVVAPDGSVTAAHYNTTGTKVFGSSVVTLAPGDWVIAGLWYKGTYAGGWPRLYRSGGGRFTFTNRSVPHFELHPNNGFGSAAGWEWRVACDKVATADGTAQTLTLATHHLSGTTVDASVWRTLLLHIPAGTMSDKEVLALANRVRPTPGTAYEAGAVALDSHQKLYLGGGSLIYGGAGSPEGVVYAPVGSIYLRRDGSTGTALYVKEIGTGNTGWVAK